MVGLRVRLAGITLVVVITLILAGCSLQPLAQPPTRSLGAEIDAAQPANTRVSASSPALPLNTSQPGAAVSPSSGLTPSAGPAVYWGAYVSPDIYGLSESPLQSLKPVDLFEAHAGRGLSILHWSHPWFSKGAYSGFDSTLMDAVRQHGSLSLLDWNSESLGISPEYNQPRFSLSTIIDGSHDAYIRQWAADARAWGHPFFLRFDQAMNGDGYPWSEMQNGNSSGEFVQAWRHVHDIFTQVGTANATWVWCPDVETSGPIPLAGLYPGDAYVDWTCMNGYNNGSSPSEPDGWTYFGNLFWLTYNHLLAIAPSKPIMIGEVASTESGGSKADWITDALTVQLPQNFPQVRALVWMNAGGTRQDWSIESSAAARTAFAAAIKSAYYAGNSFAELADSPIAPPGGPIQAVASASLPPTLTPNRTAAPAPPQSAVPDATAAATPTLASPGGSAVVTPAGTARPVLAPTPVATATGVPTLAAPPLATAAVPLAPGVIPVGQRGNWNLIFNDEFNGPTLDTTRWTTCYPWQTGTCSNTINGEVELYNTEDVLIDRGAGILRLRAQQRDMVGWNGQTFHYTSGIVTTGGIDGQQAPSFSYTYGYAEARVRVPKGQGLWTAFWAAPTTYVWPPEMDIMEILGHQPTVDNFVYHWTDSGGTADHAQNWTWTGPDFSAGYQVVGMDWTRDAIVWYVDGVERARYSQAANIYNKPMYLILNLAVGGWAGPPDASTPFPSYFDIDYVRVWQRAAP